MKTCRDELLTSPFDPIETLLTAAVSPRREGAVIGTLCAFSHEGRPLVTVSGSQQVPEEARSCVRLTPDHVGRSVVMMFEDNHSGLPIIVGLLEQPAVERESRSEPAADGVFEPITADVDGRRVVLSAREEIVLKCGDASITLTKAGKILLRGAYVSSHASSVNRIKGATVEIN